MVFLMTGRNARYYSNPQGGVGWTRPSINQIVVMYRTECSRNLESACVVGAQPSINWNAHISSSLYRKIRGLLFQKSISLNMCVLRGFLDVTSSLYGKIRIELDVGPLRGSFLITFGLFGIPGAGVQTPNRPQRSSERPPG